MYEDMIGAWKLLNRNFKIKPNLCFTDEDKTYYDESSKTIFIGKVSSSDLRGVDLLIHEYAHAYVYMKGLKQSYHHHDIVYIKTLQKIIQSYSKSVGGHKYKWNREYTSVYKTAISLGYTE